jgi:Flp pilus assembly protein TadB
MKKRLRREREERHTLELQQEQQRRREEQLERERQQEEERRRAEQEKWDKEQQARSLERRLRRIWMVSSAVLKSSNFIAPITLLPP